MNFVAMLSASVHLLINFSRNFVDKVMKKCIFSKHILNSCDRLCNCMHWSKLLPLFITSRLINRAVWSLFNWFKRRIFYLLLYLKLWEKSSLIFFSQNLVPSIVGNVEFGPPPPRKIEITQRSTKLEIKFTQNNNINTTVLYKPRGSNVPYQYQVLSSRNYSILDILEPGTDYDIQIASLKTPSGLPGVFGEFDINTYGMLCCFICNSLSLHYSW